MNVGVSFIETNSILVYQFQFQYISVNSYPLRVQLNKFTENSSLNNNYNNDTNYSWHLTLCCFLR